MSLHCPWLLCGIILFSAISSGGQTAAAKSPSPTPGKPSVQVFFTASDKHDSPAMAAQSELSISVDKQPAQINTLRSAKNDALLFAVLVDMSGSGAPDGDSIKNAAMQLFRSLSTDGDRGYLALFNDSVVISPQTLQVSEVRGLLNGVEFGGGTAVHDAIVQTCIQKLGRSGNPDTPRRAILLISDGDDNASNINHTEAEAAAEKEGVEVFSLVIRSSRSQSRGEHFLKEMSQDTGGQAISVKNPTDGVAPLLAAIENQWAVSFVPAQSLNQKSHSLDIKSTQKDVRISAPAHIFVQ